MRFQIGAFFPTRDMPADRVAIRDWTQTATYGQGRISLWQPDARPQGQVARLHGYLRDAGRDPAGFGSEAWIRSSIGGPDQWREASERWLAPGASHITLYTSGQGVGSVEQQIIAMRQFHDAVC